MTNRKFYWSGMVSILLCCLSPRLSAQTYEQMWKQVEAMENKQLPKSAAAEAERIRLRAQSEKNVPQLIKASLAKASFIIDVTPDSVASQLNHLKKQVREEKDPVHKAVLNYLIGHYTMAAGKREEAEADSAIAYFRLARREKEILLGTSAKSYRPLTVSKELSEKYCNDNMYQLIARQSVDRLQGYWFMNPVLREKTQTEVLSIYDELIACYKKEGMREAQLLAMLNKLYCQGYEEGRGGVNEKLRLNDEQVIALLKQWAVEFEDLPLCAEVYCQLANRYDETKDYVSKLEAARSGLEKYPRSASAESLKAQVAEVLTPDLLIDIPFGYPKAETDMMVRYRNLKGFTIELYRMSLPVTSGVLEKEINASVVGKYGKLLHSTHYKLAATPNYQVADTVFHYTFPEEGIYVLKSVPDENPKQVTYEKAYISSLQAVVIALPDGKNEVNVVDKLTGHPVGGTEVVYYTVVPGGGYREIKKYTTDSKGCAVFTAPREMNNWLGMNVRRPEADYMEICYAGFGAAGYTPALAPRWERHVSLFTDRALYRPGQPVHVAGLAYEQCGDEMRVLSKTTHELIMRDVNGQVVQKLNPVTDEDGNFYGDFLLPQDLLPGEFEVAVKEGESRFIRVDQYKRPTFDVTFFPSSSAYAAGDTVWVSGEAKTFAGIPVGECGLVYKVTRSRNTFRGPADDSMILTAGKLRTDADGGFRFLVLLSRPANYKSDMADQGYIYTVTAEVTGAAGETQSRSLSIPVGNQSLFLYIRGLRAKAAREKKDSIRIVAVNPGHRAVKVPVVCTVYARDKNNGKGKEVCRQTADAGVPFVFDEFSALPAGRYRMEAVAADPQGRTCRTQQDFVVFSLADRRLPVHTPEWFYQDGTEFDARRPVDLYVGSSEQGVYLFYDVFCGNERIESRRMTLNDEIRKFSYTYKPEYGDGILVNFAFMRKGQLYTKKVSITRPRPRKELHLKWKTFRDKLQPGGQETWELQVTSPEGKAVDACLLATLYDASLDQLYVNDWDFKLNIPRSVPSVGTGLIAALHSIHLHTFFPYKGSFWRGLWWNDYSCLQVPHWQIPVSENAFKRKTESRMTRASDRVAPEEENMIDKGFEAEDGTFAVAEFMSETIKPDDGSPYVPLRENFAETAFFYPGLRTDSGGIVRIAFLLPESLTGWKFMGAAHTRTMNYGTISARAKAVKPFMVQPNMPRFIRVGDKVVISAAITNLSGKPVRGTARLELADAQTNKLLSAQTCEFSAGADETAAVSFPVEAPEESSAVVCRIMAEGGDFSDGEQHVLAVLPDKQRITETVPVQLNGTESRSVSLKELFNGGSKTASNKRLTVELTANPAWYAIRALPVTGTPTEEDALTMATAYYANSLSEAIVARNPSIRRVFESWKVQRADGYTPSEVSDSRRELKQISLKETPWLEEFANEAEQKRSIAYRFDKNVIANRNRNIIGHLKELQQPDGSWSWYKGMSGNRYVTTRIVELAARMQAMNIAITPMEEMYKKAVAYLRRQWMEAYAGMRKEERKGKKEVRLDEQSVTFLYICALDKEAAQQSDKAAYDYMINKLENGSAGYTIYNKARAAVIWQEAGKKDKAERMVRSILEYAVYTPETGRCFDTSKADYSPGSYRIPAQVAAMEAVSRVLGHRPETEEMKLWLLKQKQVQMWNTPIATADAVYAFLSESDKLPAEAAGMKAVIGNKSVMTPADALGYTCCSVSGEENLPAAVEVSRTGSGIGWGTVYGQYLEETDKVSASSKNKGLKINRTYYKDGKEVSGKTELHVGDELTVALTVKCDRDMDFVRIRDMRAACMEPKEALSGWHYADGTGYYLVTRDASTEVFLEKLPKGTARITYRVYLDRPGTCRTGSAVVQSVYAPEFVNHTRSVTVTVSK